MEVPQKDSSYCQTCKKEFTDEEEKVQLNEVGNETFALYSREGSEYICESCHDEDTFKEQGTIYTYIFGNSQSMNMDIAFIHWNGVIHRYKPELWAGPWPQDNHEVKPVLLDIANDNRIALITPHGWEYTSEIEDKDIAHNLLMHDDEVDSDILVRGENGESVIVPEEFAQNLESLIGKN